MLNVTLNRNSTRNRNSEMFKVQNLSSIFTIMPNGDNDYKAILKELHKKKLDRRRIHIQQFENLYICMYN